MELNKTQIKKIEYLGYEFEDITSKFTKNYEFISIKNKDIRLMINLDDMQIHRVQITKITKIYLPIKIKHVIELGKILEGTYEE